VLSAERRGFTLVEVLVALALSAMVIGGARGLLEGLARQAGQAMIAASSDDSRANAAWAFRQLVANLALPSGDSAAFDGDARQALFASRCAVGGGWQERCDVSLVAEPLSSGTRVLVVLSTNDTIALGTASRGAELRYLGSARDGGRWLRGWERSLALPLAIGVIMDDDTLVARVGERR
jgi:prepilin-type N-terminal cleavage/methylation domain-containing protein